MNLATKRPRITPLKQAGFTIVELMIATVVFSLVLIVILTGVLHFTAAYYKGVNSSSTQVVAQNALDAITQAIQFSGMGTTTSVATNGSLSYFCAGNKEFVYVAGQEYDGGTPSSNNPGLYEINSASCSSTPTITNGTELLGKNMRVASVSLSQDADNAAWNVKLVIAYGDGDLLCNTGKDGNTGGCNPGDGSYAPTAAVVGEDVRCKLTTGSQFCSVSALSTAVTPRVEG